jgi:uncharacterized repeat protein (TIGR01451 family)
MKTKTKNKINYKRVKGILLPLLAMASVLTFLPAYHSIALEAGWGPERPTTTYPEPSNVRTFNSMLNNPAIGDERNFVRVREAGVGNFLDEVTLEIGKEYEVYIYYHNNASASLNASGAGVAANVRLSSNMPRELHRGEIGQVTGTITSSNTIPASVWDSAFLRANDTVYLRYVPGSAVLHNSGTANGAVLSGEALFSDQGVLLAHSNAYWGLVPGCNEFAGHVIYRFFVDQPKFFLSKEVSKELKNDWGAEVYAVPGETLDFKITYSNIGTTEQKSVSVYDTLPVGMEYLPGSTIIVNGSNIDGKRMPDTLFTDNGLVIGDYLPGLGERSSATITYKLRVTDDEKLFPCDVAVPILNNASVATANGTMYDSARITVVRECGTPGMIPRTGPGEIAVTIIAILSITVGGAYWYRSRRALKMVESYTVGDHGIDKG